MAPVSGTVLGALVGAATEQVFAAVADAVAPNVRAWLGREPARLAFQTALLRAINRFAAAHPEWADALLDEPFFTSEAVTRELARFLTRRDAPDVNALAKAWAAQLPRVGARRRDEAARALADFLRLFEEELGNQEALQPLFDSRALERIAANIDKLVDLVQTTLRSWEAAWYTLLSRIGSRQIVAESVWGSVLITGHHNVVYQNVVSHYPSLKDYIYDFSDTIQELTRDFVGREFLVAEAEAFIAAHDQGIFRLQADAGLGKSTVAAAWARYFKAPIFFFGSRGSTSPARCLEHLCAELIVRYNLKHTHLPARAGEDGNFLKTLLREAYEKTGQPVVLVIDALDEAEGSPSGYWLPLPDPLPKGAYIFVTHRPGDYPLPGAPGLIRLFDLRWDDPRQQQDIERYLRQQARRLHDILEAARITSQEFVSALKEKSEGNFMYLTYVIGDIARREPGFDPLRLDTLPQGLKGYYEHFWQQMARARQQSDYAEWRNLFKRTLAFWAVAGEPVPVAWIADLVGRDAEEIRERVLLPWQRFLRRQRAGEERWSIVHQSFADFLADKIDLRTYHRQVAKFYANSSRRQYHRGYAFRHLTHHLVQADAFNKLTKLIETPAWYVASKAYDPSRRLFAEDVGRALTAAERAVEERQHVEILPHVVAWSLLEATVRTLATRVPIEALETMVLLGETDRALGYAALITDPAQQAAAYRCIGAHLHAQGQTARARKALGRALAAAQAIADADDRARALAAVAQALAQVRTAQDHQVACRVVAAFRWARQRGRDEVWAHIRAFAPVLGKLGVIGETWQHIQAVETVVWT